MAYDYPTAEELLINLAEEGTPPDTIIPPKSVLNMGNPVDAAASDGTVTEADLSKVRSGPNVSWTTNGDGDVSLSASAGAEGEGVITVAASDAKTTDGADFVCDGADDHLTINDAINALPSYGGRVVFTEGTFYLGGAVTDQGKPHVQLTGEGDATHLRLDGGVSTNCLAMTDCDSLDIDTIRVDGNGPNQSDGGNRDSQCGIYAEECNIVRVHSVTVEDTVYSNIRNQARDNTLSHYRVTDCWLDGTRSGVTDNVSDAVSASGNADGDNKQGSINWQLITGNVMTATGHSFVEIADDGTGIIIANNFMSSTNSGAKGVDVHGNTDYGMVANNYVHQPNASLTNFSAIHGNVNNCNFIGNIINHAGSGDGLRIESNSTYTPSEAGVIAGNVVRQAGNDGIHLPDGIGGALVAFNKINNAGNYGVNLTGSNHLVVGNLISSATSGAYNNGASNTRFAANKPAFEPVVEHPLPVSIPTTNYASGLSDAEIWRINLGAGEALEIDHLDVSLKGGGSNTSFTVDVYDATNATKLVADTADSASGDPLATSPTGVTILLRLTNSTGASQNASISMSAHKTV